MNQLSCHFYRPEKPSLGKIFRQTVQWKGGLQETARIISIKVYSRPMIACFKKIQVRENFRQTVQWKEVLETARSISITVYSRPMIACFKGNPSLRKNLQTDSSMEGGLRETARIISIAVYSRPMIACFKVTASDNSSPCLIRCLMRSESNGISEMGRESQFFL
ncbi:hypothetical protein CEXT_751101 [Caerostris extrusa]|uniref:Uncharacterized protein n=1 Tax=Caerostris extrusa TaxID=172846 RepID=A0AAV4U0X0_CAEEX|nr:hypothetical protein CEXT_751101 [Caerostris extrusa]